jgi:tRNA threonylcarbamoyladenosine biosynthesis protein TsaE
MRYLKAISKSEQSTLEAGQRLAEEISGPTVILLFGELGAGKTLLTKGIAKGLGVEDMSLVHSPSFSLVNEYSTPDHTIFHIDLYRLDTARDHYSIGLEEILDSGEYVVIEWADKLLFPVTNPVRVTISVIENNAREIVIDQGEEDEADSAGRE